MHEPEKNQEGSGLDESPNSSETSESSSIKEKSPENDVLNKLNEKSKAKLDSKVYQSFLHPNSIKTGSMMNDTSPQKLFECIETSFSAVYLLNFVK